MLYLNVEWGSPYTEIVIYFGSIASKAHADCLFVFLLVLLNKVSRTKHFLYYS